MQNGTREVGELDPIFVAGKLAGEFRFALGARTWLAQSINREQKLIQAVPVRTTEQSIWRGNGRWMSWELCQTIREIICGTRLPSHLAPSARFVLDNLQQKYRFLPRKGNVFARFGRSLRLYTFGGGAANALMAFLLRKHFEMDAVSSSFYILVPFYEGVEADLSNALTALKRQKRPNINDAESFGAFHAGNRRMKFSCCLSQPLEAIHLAQQLTDIVVTREVIRTPIVKSCSL